MVTLVDVWGVMKCEMWKVKCKHFLTFADKNAVTNYNNFFDPLLGLSGGKFAKMFERAAETRSWILGPDELGDNF